MASERALHGRTVLVTGGSRGIGLACATMLAAAGARVAIVARGEAALAAASRRIGERAHPVQADVSDVHAVVDLARRVRAAVGAVDIVVNNAGRFAVADVEATSVALFAEVVHTNLVAPFAVVRTFLPELRERGGHVVTIGSVADRAVFPGNAAYAASKFGLRALHEVLSAELRGSAVRTTLVSPGPVDTPLWDPVDPDSKPGFTPRAAMLRPEAVAAAVLYAVTAPADVNVDELRLSRR